MTRAANHHFIAFVALIIACVPILTYADSDPLPIRDLNPLLAGYELPPALPSSPAQSGSTQLYIQYDISNTSLDQAAASEHVIIDGEVHRWQLTLNHTFSEQLTLSAELPYQSITGGSLDGFIENFHHTFGLPNGNRATWPRNRLLVSDSNNNQVAYQLNEPSNGLGDISLRAGWHFSHALKHAATVWLSIKLPTGDAQRLVGSGSTDAALSLAANQLLGEPITSYEQLSLSWLGSGERMEDRQRHLVWRGTLGLDWSLTEKLSVLVQADAHTQVFDSDIRVLGNSLQLSFGPRYRSGAWQTTLLMSEDIAVDTAPDVQFQLNVGRGF